MGKWREAFEEGRPSSEDRSYGCEYTFGPPATKEQLDQAEHGLGVRLPDDLRNLLQEFNGVRYTTRIDREKGYEASKLFLDTEDIAGVIDLLVDTGNDIPPVEDLKKVVFFWQSNGYADLYGICLEPVAGFPAGAVVHLDHEDDSLHEGYPDLLTFVRRHGKQ